ncbi:hypothetical protein AAY473_030963 [Plecturocebus cupreus]
MNPPYSITDVQVYTLETEVTEVEGVVNPDRATAFQLGEQSENLSRKQTNKKNTVQKVTKPQFFHLQNGPYNSITIRIVVKIKCENTYEEFNTIEYLSTLKQVVGSQGQVHPCGSAGYSPPGCFHELVLSACSFSKYMVQTVSISTILGSEDGVILLTVTLESATMGTLCEGSNPIFPLHIDLVEVLYEGFTHAADFCLDIQEFPYILYYLGRGF